MKQDISKTRLGTHGENYGSWMSNPVFYMIGGLIALSAVLAALSFLALHVVWLGVVFSILAVVFIALICWCAWIRKQYAFGGGGMMERVHRVVLSHLDFDGKGTLLDAARAHCPFWRRLFGGMPRSRESTIGVRHTATARKCARKMPRARAWLIAADFSMETQTSLISPMKALTPW